MPSDEVSELKARIDTLQAACVLKDKLATELIEQRDAAQKDADAWSRKSLESRAERNSTVRNLRAAIKLYAEIVGEQADAIREAKTGFDTIWQHTFDCAWNGRAKADDALAASAPGSLRMKRIEELTKDLPAADSSRNPCCYG